MDDFGRKIFSGFFFGCFSGEKRIHSRLWNPELNAGHAITPSYLRGMSAPKPKVTTEIDEDTTCDREVLIELMVRHVRAAQLAKRDQDAARQEAGDGSEVEPPASDFVAGD